MRHCKRGSPGSRARLRLLMRRRRMPKGTSRRPHRGALPDLSLTLEELETALDCLVSRLNVAVAAIDKLAGAADDAFEAVRLLIEDETFRRLEPHVADNLRRSTARSAGRERTALAARIDERVTIVQSELENQQRDQNACLQQLRLYVMHADDLLRRAARSSLIPDHVPIYGGEFGEPESKHRRACTLDHRRSEPCLAQHTPTLRSITATWT